MKSAEEIRQLLNSPADPGLEYIATPSVYEREILQGYKMDVCKYGFDLDRFCPAKMGQLTVIVGHTNVGKTTVILYLLSLLMRQGKKVLIYSAENRISTIHRQLTRFFFEQEHVTGDHLKTIRPLVRYIKHEKHFSYREMLNQATYLIDAEFEFDFFLVDPYNSLRLDNSSRLNTHDYHYQAAEEMRIFTAATNRSIFLNCHTVTEAQRVKPDADGHRSAPLDSDVEGGSKFPNKADDSIVIHRQISSKIPGEKYISQIHVRKVRNQEFGGEPTPFDEPVKLKFRLDRTGFDKITTMAYNNQSINYYETSH
jgi:energy-coupling factor transporter ATP-binding protein EcfA2